MKYLKLFENYKGPIFPKSKFTQEDMDELYDLFQDIAVEYNIKDMTIKTPSLISSLFEEPDVEINQYIIAQSRNEKDIPAFVDLILFNNIEEIIETLKDNFIPMVKNTLDWYIPSYMASQRLGMTVTNHKNDNGTIFAEVSITFAKRD